MNDSPVLQISDFVAGTVRRFLEDNDSDAALNELLEILQTLDVWPRSKRTRIIDEETTDLDMEIEKHCTTVSLNFLELNDDPLLSESVSFFLNSYTKDKDNFIYGDQLIDHLIEQQLISEAKEKAWLQQRIIAPLRDAGVPIAASLNGYKIPRSQADLKEFVDFVSHKTLPYLKKVNNMRTSLSDSLSHDYDMLNENEELKQLMKSLSINIR